MQQDVEIVLLDLFLSGATKMEVKMKNARYQYMKQY